MKKLESLFRAFLLVVLLFSFNNCTKDEDTSSPTIDYKTFTDTRDGKSYRTIKIGDMEWMADNLAYQTTTGSWCYSANEENVKKYGRLYTWDAAKLAVPSGWHLPTDEEWKELEKAIGMNQVDVDKKSARGTDQGLKLKMTSGWANDGNGTNEVGFSALPGGFRSNSGNFMVKEWYGYWWSGTEVDNLNAWYRLIVSTSSTISRDISYKGEGYSVRCVKD